MYLGNICCTIYNEFGSNYRMDISIKKEKPKSQNINTLWYIFLLYSLYTSILLYLWNGYYFL